MKDFKEIIFKQDAYNSAKSDQEGYIKVLEALLSVLKEQGAPTSKEFIERITASETALGDWVNEQYNKRIDAEYFMPPAEKKRINDIYHETFVTLHDPTERVRSLIESGKLHLTEKKGKCTVNEVKMEEVAREAGTKRFDIQKMQEYHKVMSKFIDAMKELQEYETKQGLPQTTEMNHTLYDNKITSMPPIALTYLQEGATEETFQAFFGKHFKK